MTSSIADAPRSAIRAIHAAWMLIGATPVLMALVTWRYGPIDPVLAWMRFIAPPVLAAELVLILVAWRHGARLPPAPNWLLAVAAALLLVVANGIRVAGDPWMAEIRAAVSVLHIGAGVAAASLAARPGADVTVLWRAVALGGLGYALAAGLYVGLIPDWSAHDWQRFGLGVTNIRHAGFYAAAGVSAALALACRPGALSWALAALPPATLILWSGSRGGMAALLAGSVLAAMVARRHRIRLPLMVAGVLALAAGIALLLPQPTPSAPVRIAEAVTTGTNISSGRIDMWLGTLKEVVRRPLLGHGEGQFITTPPGADIFHHPHQALLQLLFQWGIAGAVLVTLLLLIPLRRARRAVTAASDPLLPGAALLLTFAVYMSYDGILFFVYPAMLVTVVLGTLAGAGGVASGASDRYLRSR
ncbi:O-antigen ligase [Sphingomonas jejuensis]|uniref:O-antigen ligase n=1 Tax=Sphingomonas jejuensis TaxID=904715 RepID=A0ABX0XJG2_9SPHN|nr:O-antigen ligase family protein [Sphingomonas jejuensis]NJC33483.1 O-antigen ligase [Sphingomonas jejuensis]